MAEAPRPTLRVIGEAEDSGERRSHYLLTLSSNYRPTGPADQAEVESLFTAALQDAFYNEYQNMLNWMQGLRVDRVRDVEVDIAVETGGHPQGMRVHGHVRMDIRHATRIQVDYYKLRHVVMRYIDLHGLGDRVRGLYVNIQLIHNHDDAIKKYQEKRRRIARQSSAASRRRQRATPTQS